MAKNPQSIGKLAPGVVTRAAEAANIKTPVKAKPAKSGGKR